MSQIHGVVEFCLAGDWYEVINAGSLLLAHSDLNGCLFGVDNHGEFVPLFPDRGLPLDCSFGLRERVDGLLDAEAHPSWVSWKELAAIDWSEAAPARDHRTTEFAVGEDGTETAVTKWLSKPGLEAVTDALDRDPASEVKLGARVFRRLTLRRADALAGTDFPLVMRLMQCLAERFGDDQVRLIVWFG